VTVLCGWVAAQATSTDCVITSGGIGFPQAAWNANSSILIPAAGGAFGPQTVEACIAACVNPLQLPDDSQVGKVAMFYYLAPNMCWCSLTPLSASEMTTSQPCPFGTTNCTEWIYTLWCPPPPTPVPTPAPTPPTPLPTPVPTPVQPNTCTSYRSPDGSHCLGPPGISCPSKYCPQGDCMFCMGPGQTTPYALGSGCDGPMLFPVVRIDQFNQCLCTCEALYVMDYPAGSCKTAVVTSGGFGPLPPGPFPTNWHCVGPIGYDCSKPDSACPSGDCLYCMAADQNSGGNEGPNMCNKAFGRTNLWPALVQVYSPWYSQHHNCRCICAEGPEAPAAEMVLLLSAPAPPPLVEIDCVGCKATEMCSLNMSSCTTSSLPDTCCGCIGNTTTHTTSTTAETQASCSAAFEGPTCPTVTSECVASVATPTMAVDGLYGAGGTPDIAAALEALAKLKERVPGEEPSSFDAAISTGFTIASIVAMGIIGWWQLTDYTSDDQQPPSMHTRVQTGQI
jgi:hypothetical protein